MAGSDGGALDQEQADAVRIEYRALLMEGEVECPPPDEDKEERKGKRGPIKRSKVRNLLERLINYEDEVLGFMTDERIPYTNNQGERDLRMSKVQQKISGCFRSMQGAYNFARIRSYISTCIKHGVSATDALNLAIQGDLPTFMEESLG
jgi:transposase